MRSVVCVDASLTFDVQRHVEREVVVRVRDDTAQVHALVRRPDVIDDEVPLAQTMHDVDVEARVVDEAVRLNHERVVLVLPPPRHLRDEHVMFCSARDMKQRVQPSCRPGCRCGTWARQFLPVRRCSCFSWVRSAVRATSARRRAEASDEGKPDNLRRE